MTSRPDVHWGRTPASAVRHLRWQRRVYRAWVAQGRIREWPVVVYPGVLRFDAAGFVMEGWVFSGRYMANPTVDFDRDLISYLAKTFPESVS